MRDGVLLATVIILGAGSVFLWWSHGDPTRPLDSLVRHEEIRNPDSAPTAQPLARKTPAAVTHKRVSSSATVTKQLVAVLVEPAPVTEASTPPAAAPVAAKEPPPFPAAEQIAVGLQEEAITATYGNATASTWVSSRGHVIEDLVYTQNGGHSATIIHVEDGKVSSAYSKVEPRRLKGVSSPRPKPSE